MIEAKSAKKQSNIERNTLLRLRREHYRLVVEGTLTTCPEWDNYEARRFRFQLRFPEGFAKLAKLEDQHLSTFAKCY